jgi:predicted site-specific integrase-resolvase
MEKLININDLYNIEQAIDYLGITRVTFYTWVKEHKITPIIIAGKTFIAKEQTIKIKEERKPSIEV